VGEADRRRLLSEAHTHTRVLGRSRLRHARLYHALLDAQLHALGTEQQTALESTRAARAQGSALDFQPMARSLEYMQGLLERGEAGAQSRLSALAFFSEQGWKNLSCHSD
jgi:hypothetical protein